MSTELSSLFSDHGKHHTRNRGSVVPPAGGRPGTMIKYGRIRSMHVVDFTAAPTINIPDYGDTAIYYRGQKFHDHWCCGSVRSFSPFEPNPNLYTIPSPTPLATGVSGVTDGRSRFPANTKHHLQNLTGQRIGVCSDYPGFGGSFSPTSYGATSSAGKLSILPSWGTNVEKTGGMQLYGIGLSEPTANLVRLGFNDRILSLSGCLALSWCPWVFLEHSHSGQFWHPSWIRTAAPQVARQVAGCSKSCRPSRTAVEGGAFKGHVSTKHGTG